MPVVIICPSCDARFSVLEDLIPATGRQMRCNNCGHRWHGTIQIGIEEKAKRFSDQNSPAQTATPSSHHDDSAIEAWHVPQRSVKVATASLVRRVTERGRKIMAMGRRWMRGVGRLIWRVLRIPFNIIKRLVRLALKLAIVGAIAFGVLRVSCYGHAYVPPQIKAIFAKGCGLSNRYEKMMMPYVRKTTRAVRAYGSAYLPSREINMMSEFFSDSLSHLPSSLPFLEEEPATKQRPSEPVVRRGR